MQPSELTGSGFAIVNPGATDAIVTFRLYRSDGSVDTTSNLTIRARGQIAKLASEIFPAAADAGWAEATSATTGLQGFWFAGDFSNFADGAEPPASSADLVLPIVAPQSELHVANTGTADVVAQIRAYGPEGFEMAQPVVRVIRPKGFFKAQTSALFPSLALTSATHLRLTCINPFAATLVVRDFIVGPSWAVLNAVPKDLTQTILNFPQLVDGVLGAANYKSVLGVTNLSANTNDVNITFTTDDGLQNRTIQRSIPPNGSIRDLARNFFGITEVYASGWMRVIGNQPLAGFVAYADANAGSVTIVPPQIEPQTNLLFSHIADLEPWWTGLALLNTGARAATVEVFALNPDGSLIGGADNVVTARLSLAPGAKIAKLLGELIPQTQTRTSDGGFVFVRSDVPLFGIQLFFTRNLKILANVAAGRVVSGLTYTPPPPR